MVDFIQDFMRSHRLSEKKMAAILGVRSANWQTQINGGKLTGAAAVQLEQTMLSCFELTEAERAALHAAVQKLTLGQEKDALKTREMWAYLRGDVLQEPGDVVLYSPQSGEHMTVSERYARARNVRVTLLNTPYSSVYSALPALITERGATVDHYVLVNEDAARTIRLAAEMQRLIVLPGYECYTRLEEKNEQCSYGMERSDVMVCLWEDEAGACWHDMIIFTGPRSAQLLDKPFSGKTDGRLGIEQGKYQRLRHCFEGHGTLDDYLRMVTNYAAMEKNSTIYALRPDLCMVSVPPEVLRAAALDEGGMLPFNDETADVIEKMVRIFEQRYANIEQKHARTWTFLKRESMENFARTGVLSAHFWGMRPFTPAERRRILAEQLRLMWGNPGYRLFFLRDDCRVKDIDLCCYEHAGVLLSDGHTDYNIEAGYSEVLMGYKRFMKLFEEFAQEKLIEQCSSERESRAIIKNLIALTVEVEKQENKNAT